MQIHLKHEEDGRWIAEIPELAGVLAYGATEDEALRNVFGLAYGVIGDRIKNGEACPQYSESEAFCAIYDAIKRFSTSFSANCLQEFAEDAINEAFNAPGAHLNVE